MQKAKSRLKSSAKNTPKDAIAASHPKKPKKLRIKKYLNHLHLLFLATLFYAGVIWVFNAIYPQQIKNILLPNSYLPLQGLLFFGNFLLFSFLFLKSRRGFFTALIINSWFFFKFQQIENFWVPWGWMMLLLIILELVFTLKEKRK